MLINTLVLSLSRAVSLQFLQLGPGPTEANPTANPAAIAKWQ